MRFLFSLLLGLLVLFPFSSHAAKEEIVVPKEYTIWLEAIKKEMLSKGISQETIDKAYTKNYYRYKPEIVAKDRNQAEFILTTTDYLNRVINPTRVKTAQQKYKELYPSYKSLEKKYGVPFNYIISFWGLESNFGTNFGGFEIIDALTTLAYDNRRGSFFKKELYHALRIIDDYGLEPEYMEGSWAGAMGNFQFMPSTFTAYAVDGDGDDIIDIWGSFDDAASSAANYLSKLGWKQNEPWGQEVYLDYNFDYGHSGLGTVKTVSEWKKLGVKGVGGKELSFKEDYKSSIIIPEGRKGKSYIVLDNFKKIMIWNRSENYALAVSKLADYTISGKQWSRETEPYTIAITNADILKVQKFINKHKIAKIDEDGKFGSKTKEAIKLLQKKANLPQDGYPDYRLLRKIDKYNPKHGFTIPVPDKKLYNPI